MNTSQRRRHCGSLREALEKLGVNYERYINVHASAAPQTRADVTAAMSVEGLLGTDRVFAADLQALRPQAGQAASAASLVTSPPRPPANAQRQHLALTCGAVNQR